MIAPAAPANERPSKGREGRSTKDQNGAYATRKRQRFNCRADFGFLTLEHSTSMAFPVAMPLYSRKHDNELQLCSFRIPAARGDLRALALHIRKTNLERLVARGPDASQSHRSSTGTSVRT